MTNNDSYGISGHDVSLGEHGDEREVMFQQEHVAGRMAQSDFTVMNAPGITIAGTVFPHLVYHLVLTYSNVEAVRVCLSRRRA